VSFYHEAKRNLYYILLNDNPATFFVRHLTSSQALCMQKFFIHRYQYWLYKEWTLWPASPTAVFEVTVTCIFAVDYSRKFNV